MQISSSEDLLKEFQISPWDARIYGNASYRVVGRKLDWFQAQVECARDGGHLASIHSDAQSKELLAMAKRDGFPLWIGLSNQDVSLVRTLLWQIDMTLSTIQCI